MCTVRSMSLLVVALCCLTVGAAKLRKPTSPNLDLTKDKVVVALDRDMKTKMLVQISHKVSQPDVKDPCGEIQCPDLKCPAGFVITEYPGHCCSYCVNPAIKVETLTGATGEFGGKASTFCNKVWCFPTLCQKTETAPTTTNGQCCPVCPSLLQISKAPEDELAKEMTHDLEMNFNKIAPFGKEDTAKELQDHAAKTQDTLVDAVENAEVAEIKRAVFRALTRLRAATIKEFDTIARLETQAIDAYNDAHHYRAENPLTHLHEDEAPVETDKLKSFH